MPSIVAQKYGVFNVIVFFTVVMGVLIYCLGAIKTSDGFVAFAVIFGFFSGGGIRFPLFTVLALTQFLAQGYPLRHL